MRFNNIEEFGIDDLMLDQGNYRFRKAEDQTACIHKIYWSNPTTFMNLMTSLAEEDLGELLLVYKKEEDAIVLDGNRRTAALKVLWDPNLAPTANVKKKAQELFEKTSFNFGEIQAQVSESERQIYQTVFERHASRNGTRRLDWSAIASARFRYDNKIDDQGSWKATALILSLENVDDSISEFIDSKDYSHEVFSRIVRAAIKNKVISDKIFNEKEMRIKKRPKDLLDDAIKKSHAFLHSIEAKELTLSRKGESYADAEKINSYLQKFSSIELKESIELSSDHSSSEESGTNSSEQNDLFGNKPESVSTGSHQVGDEKEGESNTEDKGNETDNPLKTGYSTPPNTIQKSSKMTVALHTLGSDKLDQLYNSLCLIPLKKHASLMHVGAWTFLEVLATLAGKNANSGLESFYNGKINLWFSDKSKKLELRTSAKYVIDEGNVIKHGELAHSFDARHLSIHFEILEPLFLKTIEYAQEKY